MLPKLEEGAAQLIGRLQAEGHTAYLVGGAVRDLLRGQAVGDFDLACSANSETLLRLFEGAKSIGGVCGTVAVPLCGCRYEVTPYRQDGASVDHRHPDTVLPAETIEEDLARRDFTVNAIAFDGETLIDPFGGCADIEAGVLRCVGNPAQRFAEDALRILRLFRFAAVLGFSIEPETEQAALAAAETLALLPAARVREELQKLLLSPHPDALLPLLAASGLVEVCIGRPKRALSLDALPCTMLLRWWGLLHLTGSDLIAVVQSLGFSAAFYRDLALVDGFYRTLPPQDSTALKRQLRSLPPVLLPELYDAFCSFDAGWQPRRALYEALVASGEPYTREMLAVQGASLMAYGIRGGEIGRMLDLLLDAVIVTPALNETGTLLAMAASLAKLK